MEFSENPSHSPEGLGICEHCGILVSVRDWLIAVFKKDKWPVCPKCGKQLTKESFGYEKIGKDFKKMKWVGPEKKWIDKRPEKDFEIDGWYVLIHP